MCDWSIELDRVSADGVSRPPIRFDPVLAAAFADDDQPAVRWEIEVGEPCVRCGNPMRPGKMRVAEAPSGTRSHYGQKVCRTCKTGTGTVKRKRAEPVYVGQPCVLCGKRMRPHRMKADAAPRTVCYGAHKKCTQCYRTTGAAS